MARRMRRITTFPKVSYNPSQKAARRIKVGMYWNPVTGMKQMLPSNPVSRARVIFHPESAKIMR